MSTTITRSSLNAIPTSFATVSVGTPSDSLEEKLAAISSAWFQAIELGFPDLLNFANKHYGRKIADTDYSALCEAAAEIRTLCKHYNLRIMMLQPFSNFEGWPQGSKERNKAFARARGWVRIMEALGTDMLQVGSSDSEGITGDINELAGDLAELADMLAEKGFRIAYENWCWATHAVRFPFLPLHTPRQHRSCSMSPHTQSKHTLTQRKAHLAQDLANRRNSQQTQPRPLSRHLPAPRKRIRRPHHRLGPCAFSASTLPPLRAATLAHRPLLHHPRRKNIRPANQRRI